MPGLPRTRRISAVIPSFDEEQNLQELYQELCAVAEQHALDLQLVFVDDGSSDGSWRVLERLAASDARVVAVRLRRNFGKTAALSAGLVEADGEIIVLLDGDGQDDPAEIPRMLDKLDEGFDVVNGWKRERRDPLTKVVASRAFNVLVGALTGLHLNDHNCGLKVARAEVFRELRLFGNLHRFIPVLAHGRGFAVAELPVHHRPRRHGRSKYGPARFVTALLDLVLVRLLTDYRGRPQHLIGTVGLSCLAIGALALGYLALVWLSQFWDPAGYHPIASRPLTLYALGALIVGAQLTSLGVLAGLLAASGSHERAEYSVRERAPAPRGDAVVIAVEPRAEARPRGSAS